MASIFQQCKYVSKHFISKIFINKNTHQMFTKQLQNGLDKVKDPQFNEKMREGKVKNKDIEVIK